MSEHVADHWESSPAAPGHKPTPTQGHILRRMQQGWTLEIRGQSWWLCDLRSKPRLQVRDRTMVSLVKASWIQEARGQRGHPGGSWKLTEAGRCA